MEWECVSEAKRSLEEAISQAQSLVEMLGVVKGLAGSEGSGDEENEMDEARQRAAAEPFLDTAQAVGGDGMDPALEITPFPSTFSASGPRRLPPELNARFNRVLARIFAKDAETRQTDQADQADQAGGPVVAGEDSDSCPPPPSALAFAPAAGIDTGSELEEAPTNGGSPGHVQLNFANGGFSSHYTPAKPKAAAPAPDAEEEEEESPSVALPS